MKQAIWCLGNIAADLPSCRDILFDHGVVTPLLSQFRDDMKIPVLRTAMWALSNICFGKLPAEVQVGFCHHCLSSELSLIIFFLKKFRWEIIVIQNSCLAPPAATLNLI